MSGKKKLLLGFLVVLIPFLGWYFFLKQNDFAITFKVKTSTGTVFQGIQEWMKANKSDNVTFEVIEKEKFNYIQYKHRVNQKTIVHTWEITPENDSITSVKVGIADANTTLYNRLTLPFLETEYKVEQKRIISEFKTGLEFHLQNIKVNPVKEGVSEQVYVAYIELKSEMQQKAQTMIMNDARITGALFKNNIQIKGMPFVEITHWNLDTEQLQFNYCFPVDKTHANCDDKDIKFKMIPAKKGLTVSYFGNYRTSDKGWFAILDYAKKHNIQLDYKPLEHFLANPFNGGEELDWEAQIIIPFKN
jgi:effector-binding domain-containing protein